MCRNVPPQPESHARDWPSGSLTGRDTPGLGSKTGLGRGRKRGPPTAAEGLRDGDAEEVTAGAEEERIYSVHICVYVCVCVRVSRTHIYNSSARPVSGCHSEELSPINYAGTDGVTVISNYTHYVVEKQTAHQRSTADDSHLSCVRPSRFDWYFFPPRHLLRYTVNKVSNRRAASIQVKLEGTEKSISELSSFPIIRSILHPHEQWTCR